MALDLVRAGSVARGVICIFAVPGCRQGRGWGVIPEDKSLSLCFLKQNSLLDSVGEGEGEMVQENSIETCILSRVKQITSPGWMHETSARTWCTGKT